MKTKNIFRMLLVAATLLLGASNVKADNITLPWSDSNGVYNVRIAFNAFKDVPSSAILRITYRITQQPTQWYTPPYGIILQGKNNNNITIDINYEQTSCNIALTVFASIINTDNENDCSIAIQTVEGLVITGVELIANGEGDGTQPDQTDPDQTIEYVQATIGTTGKATFSNSSALNFSGVTGMKAYIATAISNDQVTLTQVTGAVAANTGLIIIGNPGDFNIPKVSLGTSYTNTNMLVAGNDNQLTLSKDYTDYVLIQDTDGKAKFAEVWSASALPTIPTGKAYLHINNSGAGVRNRSLGIVFGNGTTGISYIHNEPSENVIYNLRGQRVENPTKGLYIINGKKVVIK